MHYHSIFNLAEVTLTDKNLSGLYLRKCYVCRKLIHRKEIGWDVCVQHYGVSLN